MENHTSRSKPPTDLNLLAVPTSMQYQAMSLVPNSVKSFFDLVVNQYLPPQAMADFENEYRAINHAQIELVAGRVSALNQCVY